MEVPKMIFSELYSVYYRTVARILEAAFAPETTEEDLQRCVQEEAFTDSVLTILPALKSGKWPLLRKDHTPVLHHKPTMPLTNLEKRWLKAISEDPRVKLFGVPFPELQDVEPLFTGDDYKIYDQYADGDPFEDAHYIEHFRFLYTAIREHRPVRIAMENRHGKRVSFRCRPQGFEYSMKDDKLRVIAGDCKFRQFNLARVTECRDAPEPGPSGVRPQPKKIRELTLLITDERNALERVMLHFAHFEKQAQRLGEDQYLLHLKYDKDDETEMVIRVLSFGPCVKVLEPQHFVELIRERLIAQKNCGLR
jgi:hypothetical protein